MEQPFNASATARNNAVLDKVNQDQASALGCLGKAQGQLTVGGCNRVLDSIQKKGLALLFDLP